MENTLAKKPGWCNISKLCKVMSVCSLRTDNARTTGLFNGPVTIFVPGNSGSILEATLTGILALLTGFIVAGCNTLPPKIDSSAASSKLISSMACAVDTTLGSVV